MLTDVKIKSEKPGEARREVPDGKISGLFLIIQPTGAKSWAVRYRFQGLTKKFTIGPYPTVDLAAARKRAQEALGDVASGKDPAAVKKTMREAHKAATSTADRVENVVESFVEKHMKRKTGEAWAREGERLLRKEVIPTLGAKRLGDLKKSDIHDLLDAIVDRGAPIIANRTLAIFRRLCNWAVERGIVDKSPCDGIKAPAAEETRDRVLSDDEILLAWGAFNSAGWPFGPLAKLLLLTGARRDEIAGAKWSEINIADKTLTIAKERSKNGVAHEIPLSDGALEILSGLHRIVASGDDGGTDASMTGKAKRSPKVFVFTTNGETSVSGFSRAKEQFDSAMLEALRKAAAVRGEDPEKIAAPTRWTLHDLRRTAASGMAGIGIAPHIIEAALNHKSGTIKGVAAVYNRYSYATEKRQALDAWARRLDEILTGRKAANVVELARARQ